MGAVIQFAPGALYERQPGESRQAYQAFERYRQLGPERSTILVARELGKSKALMERWSSRWGWRERARAWDTLIEASVRDAELTAARADAKERTAKALKLRETEIDLAERLIESARQMLKWPLARTEQIDDDGRVVTIIEPARWRTADAARMVAVADQLYRLALNLETSRVTVDLDDEARAFAKRVGLDPDELAQTARELGERFGLVAS